MTSGYDAPACAEVKLSSPEPVTVMVGPAKHASTGDDGAMVDSVGRPTNGVPTMVIVAVVALAIVRTVPGKRVTSTVTIAVCGRDPGAMTNARVPVTISYVGCTPPVAENSAAAAAPGVTERTNADPGRPESTTLSGTLTESGEPPPKSDGITTGTVIVADGANVTFTTGTSEVSGPHGGTVDGGAVTTTVAVEPT
jgi:hypothetical protein